MNLTCFKAYDIRGKLGEDLNAEIARRIGRAYADVMAVGSVIVGHDARESSPVLKAALVEGLRTGGVNVTDIGLCGSEEVYFATGHLHKGGGIMVTASHNPIDYNGMKMVGPGSRPLDPATEMKAIKTAAERDSYQDHPHYGTYAEANPRNGLAAHVAGMVDGRSLQGLHVVANAGNGTAGATFDAVVAALEATGAALQVTRVHHDPDPKFPNGIPNPLLPENRAVTARAVVEAGADIGLAWDGDFDRCFFFDETGAFLDGEHVVALMARATLDAEPGASIVHDPRVIWATTETVRAAGGKPVASKTGHAYFKAKMREVNAAYGGEMSAHHYFRDFFFCDSGMIPWVRMLSLMATAGRPLSALAADLRARFPSSGEINFDVPDPHAMVEVLAAHAGSFAVNIDRLDGASIDFGPWRMNLRASNTEPLLRLNIETRGDPDLLKQKVVDARELIEDLTGKHFET